MTRLPALLVAAASLVAGCTPAPAGPDTAPTSRPGVASPSPSEPSPSPSTAEIATPSATAVAPSAPPAAPTGPAPSTAGDLTADDLTLPEGWSPAVRDGSLEEGYLGNGTWVHAVSAEHSAYAAIALGCTTLGTYPQPEAALEGTISGPEGQPGIGLALQFADADDAAAYFAEWVRQGRACEGTATELVGLTGDTWLGRRMLETVWSEAVGLRGRLVLLTIVEAPDADLSGLW